MKCGLGLAAVCGVVLFSTEARAEEKTRHFPAAKCRYTLPADGWSWTELPEKGQAVFAAKSPDGFAVILGFVEAPPSVWIGQKFVEGFDSKFGMPGELEKRGGRLSTFLGLPCYEVETRLTDGRTMASRMFIANGHIYTLGGARRREAGRTETGVRVDP